MTTAHDRPKSLPELRAAFAQAPTSAAAAFALGLAHSRRSESAESLSLMREATRLQPENLDYRLALGRTLIGARHCHEGLTELERAQALSPHSAKVLRALAWEYWLIGGRLADARRCFVQAIATEPQRLDGYMGYFGACLGDEDHHAAQRRLVHDVPEHDAAAAALGLAMALMGRGQYPIARDALSELAARSPDNVMLRLQLARAEIAIGHSAAAGQLFEHVLRASPTNGAVYRHYQAFLWRLGRFDEAAHLMRSEAAQSACGAAPGVTWWDAAWVRGRTILITDTGGAGFGDLIFCSRSALRLSELGARVIVQCGTPLVSLLATLPGVSGVVSAHDELPVIDAQCAPFEALSLLNWDEAALARQIPYLRVPPALEAQWRAKLAAHGAGVHIGLVWRAKNGDIDMQQHDPYCSRSMPLHQLAPLAGIPGVTWHSLHVGALNTAEAAERAVPMTRLSAGFERFLDTAAAVRALDAVVTVDTAVAHVAGALGRPAFLMMPYLREAMWGDASKPSPWYPSCRMFRQPAPGDWTPVVRDVALAVRELVDRHPVALAAPLSDAD